MQARRDHPPRGGAELLLKRIGPGHFCRHFFFLLPVPLNVFGRPGFRDLYPPHMCQIPNRPRNPLSPICLRARHDVRALRVAQRSHQELDLGVGPRSPFCRGRAGTLSRALTQPSALDAFLHLYAPKDDGRAKRRRKPRRHPVASTLKKAEAWQARIDSGRVESRAAIARKEGLTRARVTQVFHPDTPRAVRNNADVGVGITVRNKSKFEDGVARVELELEDGTGIRSKENWNIPGLCNVGEQDELDCLAPFGRKTATVVLGLPDGREHEAMLIVKTVSRIDEPSPIHIPAAAGHHPEAPVT